MLQPPSGQSGPAPGRDGGRGGAQRGVQVRAIYTPERARGRAPVRGHPRHGGQARMLAQLPMKLMVRDHEEALISLRDAGTGAQSVTTVAVRHPDLVAPLGTLFEQHWRKARALPREMRRRTGASARRALGRIKPGARSPPRRRPRLRLGRGLRCLARAGPCQDRLEPGDERAVDLDRVDREVMQARQRGSGAAPPSQSQPSVRVGRTSLRAELAGPVRQLHFGAAGTVVAVARVRRRASREFESSYIPMDQALATDIERPTPASCGRRPSATASTPSWCAPANTPDSKARCSTPRPSTGTDADRCRRLRRYRRHLSRRGAMGGRSRRGLGAGPRVRRHAGQVDRAADARPWLERPRVYGMDLVMSVRDFVELPADKVVQLGRGVRPGPGGQVGVRARVGARVDAHQRGG